MTDLHQTAVGWPAMTCAKCRQNIRETDDWFGTGAKPLCARCAGVLTEEAI